ncbi:MAG: biotin--[acetyl-CoA-carboxylase] ligase [Planctomycetaceae bacterium]|jgi:BirA family biotin operon repressor/biotin-[acetyl-CoA-carboxylase] ligase|nr:biotin--[acetyl-CoA-carboxylase] ligase [Planctomycetaceae bacterium]
MLKIVSYPTLVSTNDTAKELLRSNTKLELPLVIVTDRQTGGRGRDGRSWWTGEGALAFSLIVELSATKFERQTLPTLSEKIAEIVAEFVNEELLTPHEIKVHKPNDVYIDNKKVSGILIETTSPKYAIIGIGINTNNTTKEKPPELSNIPIVTLKDLRNDQPLDNKMLMEKIVKKILAILRNNETVGNTCG